MVRESRKKAAGSLRPLDGRAWRRRRGKRGDVLCTLSFARFALVGAPDLGDRVLECRHLVLQGTRGLCQPHHRGLLLLELPPQVSAARLAFCLEELASALRLRLGLPGYRVASGFGLATHRVHLLLRLAQQPSPLCLELRAPPRDFRLPLRD